MLNKKALLWCGGAIAVSIAIAVTLTVIGPKKTEQNHTSITQIHQKTEINGDKDEQEVTIKRPTGERDTIIGDEENMLKDFGFNPAGIKSIESKMDSPATKQ